MYTITRKFTGGILEGMTHSARSYVSIPVGFKCEKPIGGSPYEVIECTHNGTTITSLIETVKGVE